ncbi:hypothetical protein [Marinobacter adhaerens]|uniref:Uncharacterized protein n=1 Tax=Marinobacter adhaerens TaxID=1033846 RepID=A0ABX8IMI0_9GAMM|nr:hypothetical protein [Marinobacter adhaerens]QWV14414.1 hypothetical protein KQ249_07425 [Marinobacter adhaerens]
MSIIVKDATGAPVTVKTIDDLLKDAGSVSEGNPLPVSVQGGSSHMGRVGGTTRRPMAGFVRPGDLTAYSAGDLIANSQTATEVTPLVFEVARQPSGSGRISGATCVLEAASGSLNPLPQFDLLLFRPQGDIPYGDGLYPADNAALYLTAPQMAQLVAVIRFSDLGWRNRQGGNTGSGPLLYQTAPISPRQFAPFDLDPLGVTHLRGLVQTTAAWAAPNVGITFDFTLDVDQD